MKCTYVQIAHIFEDYRAEYSSCYSKRVKELVRNRLKKRNLFCVENYHVSVHISVDVIAAELVKV